MLSTRFEPEISASDLYWFSIEILLVFSEWISDGQQWGMYSSFMNTIPGTMLTKP